MVHTFYMYPERRAWFRYVKSQCTKARSGVELRVQGTAAGVLGNQPEASGNSCYCR